MLTVKSTIELTALLLYCRRWAPGRIVAEKVAWVGKYATPTMSRPGTVSGLASIWTVAPVTNKVELPRPDKTVFSEAT